MTRVRQSSMNEHDRRLIFKTKSSYHMDGSIKNLCLGAIRIYHLKIVKVSKGFNGGWRFRLAVDNPP